MEFADAVSVLTERSHFNGGIEYLRRHPNMKFLS